MNIGYDLYDAFADAPFQGTQIPVVTLEDDMPEALKIAIAGEFRQTETVFLDLRSGKQPFSVFNDRERTVFGAHTTLVAAYAAHERGLTNISEQVARFDLSDSDRLIHTFVDLHKAGQPDIHYSRKFTPTIDSWVPATDEIARALNIDPTHIRHSRYQPMSVAVDCATLVVPLTRAEHVLEAQLDIQAWREMNPRVYATEILLFAPGSVTGNADFHARLLKPSVAEGEYPPVGRVMPELIAFLCAQKGTAVGTHSIVVDRGSPDTRKSVIHIEFDHRSGRELQCRIGGHVIKMGTGSLTLDLPAAA